MKKKVKLLSFVGLLVVLFVTGCATSQPLNLDTLENREFKLSRITFMINQDIDPENKGAGFITEQFPGILEILESTLKENHGIELDYSDFLSEVGDKNLKIETDVIEFNMIINEYSWVNGNEYPQQITIILPFAIREDNSLMATIILTKENPENPAKDLTKSLNVNFKIVTKE